MKQLFLLTTMALLFASCATGSPEWEARVGNYTFDQAVLELGVPDRDAVLSDGSRVTEWLRSPAIYHYPFYSYDYFYTHRSTLVNRVPARILRLTFGPEGKLRAWKNIRR